MHMCIWSIFYRGSPLSPPLAIFLNYFLEITMKSVSAMMSLMLGRGIKGKHCLGKYYWGNQTSHSSDISLTTVAESLVPECFVSLSRITLPLVILAVLNSPRLDCLGFSDLPDLTSLYFGIYFWPKFLYPEPFFSSSKLRSVNWLWLSLYANLVETLNFLVPSVHSLICGNTGNWNWEVLYGIVSNRKKMMRTQGEW